MSIGKTLLMVFTMRFIMIRNDFIEKERVLKECIDFIRSIWVHTEGEDLGEYKILKKEMDILSDKTNAIITILDAYEQNQNKS
ncbi:MAG: hypothetical protein ACR2L5_02680 [Candidatus Actinomarinaceae bacterium]